MKRSLASWILVLIALTISGCKKEEPNPELLDPIYQDLDKRYKDAQKSFEDETKKRDDARTALEKAEPNTIEVKDAEKNIAKSEQSLLEFKQRSLYYKIRSERRLYEDRLNYKNAFIQNQTWPDPQEYRDYQVNIRLEEAPRNWSLRVPKLQNRLSTAAKPAKAEAKSEE